MAPGNPLSVAVTGPTGGLGALLLRRLQADPGVARILTLGPTPAFGEKIEHRTIDFTRHDAEEDLTDALREVPVDALFHLAFINARHRSGAAAHEVEVIGSMRVLAAAGSAEVGRLVVASTTAVYGARPNAPAVIGERATLAGAPTSRFIQDKIQVEQEVKAFRERHPGIRVIVLRFAPIIGQGVDNPVTRLLGRSPTPSLLGFDPLWQAIHPDDAAEALHRALTSEYDGALNVVADGVLAFSGMVRAAGGRTLPLPGPVAKAALRTLGAAGASTPHLSLLDYLRYGWVADGRRAREALGFSPRHTVSEAVRSLKARS